MDIFHFAPQEESMVFTTEGKMFTEIQNTFFVDFVIFVVEGKIRTRESPIVLPDKDHPVLFIHPLLEFLAHLKIGELFAVHIDEFAGLWISSCVG